MRDTFSEWLSKSPYQWYTRPRLGVADRKLVDMMRAAFKAGTQSEELDRAAELLRRCVTGEEQDYSGLCKDIDAFLREIE